MPHITLQMYSLLVKQDDYIFILTVMYLNLKIETKITHAESARKEICLLRHYIVRKENK